MFSRIEKFSNSSPSALTEAAVDEVKGMVQRAEQRAAEQARAANRLVRDHPYPTIGLAFGIGLLVGLLGLLAWQKQSYRIRAGECA